MPRKREGERQERVHVWLFADDWAKIKDLFGSGPVGPSKFVRTAVRITLKKVQERLNLQRKPFNAANIDVELGEDPK